MSAAIAVDRKIEPSVKVRPKGVSPEAWNAIRDPAVRLTIDRIAKGSATARATAATRARKMRMRQPARIPLGPRKTVLGAAGGGMFDSDGRITPRSVLGPDMSKVTSPATFMFRSSVGLR